MTDVLREVFNSDIDEEQDNSLSDNDTQSLNSESNNEIQAPHQRHDYLDLLCQFCTY